MFRAPIHHDAHEFFNYLINIIADVLEDHQKEYNKLHQQPPTTPLTALLPPNFEDSKGKSKLEVPKKKTWVHDLFEGVLANEIRCLTCDTVILLF